MSDPAVLYEEKDHVATLTLNRPENRNSMTEDVLEGLRAGVARAKDDAELRCLVVTGRGKSFCAGADFKSQIQRSDSGTAGAQLPNERSFAMYSPFLSLLQIEVPVIGALNGHAIGGWLRARARVRHPDREQGRALRRELHEARTAPGHGDDVLHAAPGRGSARGRAPVHRAARLGRRGGAARARELRRSRRAGAAQALELAREIASCAPIAVRWTKRSLYQNVDWDPVPAAYAEAQAQSRTLETDDSKEGIQALLEKRAPNFRGR